MRNKTRTFLVELKNTTDSRDDEVVKVKSDNAQGAASKVYNSLHGYRFSVGRVVPARGGTKYERELAKDFRTYCTKSI